ncbi:hypothetical protein [Geodermatophilus sp. SYSU D00710]
MRSYDFQGAFEEYMRAYRDSTQAGPPDIRTMSGDDLLMKSARAMQMADNWRAQVGTWERLGNSLGRRLEEEDSTSSKGASSDAYETPVGRELFGQFNVISDREWAELDDCPDECGSGCIDRRKQAWAYEWAAETAAATANPADAARLFRRAGWAWEKALHYGMARVPAQSDTDAPRGQEASSKAPESEKRLERAAACYTRAAANAARTTRRATRTMIATRPWCPACQRDKTTENGCPRNHADATVLLPEEDRPATDVDRLLRVWQGIAKIRQTRSREDAERKFDLPLGSPAAASRNGNRADDLTEGLHQLALIQGLLAGHGARHEARAIYRQRQRMEMGYYRSHARVRYLRKWTGYVFSWNGSSLPRLLGSLALLYLVLLPLIWLVVWLWTGLPKPENSASFGPAPLEAVIFSLSSMVTLSNGHFAAGGWAVNLLQACHAVSAYFALGYSLYVAQRAYTV